MSRRADPFDTRSMGLSAALHIGVLIVAWASAAFDAPEPVFQTIEIELISPDPPAPAEETQEAAEELVVETPDPEPPPPEPEPEEAEVVPEPEPEPEPEPTPPEPEPEPEETPPEVSDDVQLAEVPDEAEETPEETGLGVEVRMEGLQRDFPEYYRNIIAQIIRCHRPPRGGRNRLITVGFVINRDGSVQNLDFVVRSGNSAADFAAMEAVECAGAQGRLGPLPDELPYDRQPIRFEFRPSGDLSLEAPAYRRLGVPTSE